MSMMFDHLAIEHDVPNAPKAAILWLSGYASVMKSTKVTALAAWAKQNDIELMRFDYSGLGESGGDFAKGNLTTWLNEARYCYDQVRHRPVYIIGSSMGAWLALRLALELQGSDQAPDGLFLLAPAVDFTHELLLKALTAEQLAHFKTKGVLELPSRYDEAPLKVYHQFVEDAAKHRLLTHPQTLTVPTTIIHGQQDQDIPISLMEKAAQHLGITNVITVPDGGHRLSRDQDIALILKTVAAIIKNE
ncbi:alpha/beta hydrolase [Wohlfahrtiimonas chitiniclastica]|uniref:alpha/beta hydrolase n=1 Tax=Wohlfahrtiimonas chitiniclastica TaxID=400946 RepID=UPI000B98D94C|nr:alpha/beta hydrolase [Wohlfahrtiimonas chitiniclastica]OYQ79926.1 alpha/beta hydrolase [Wohlfahrtiimonas chitiniclastica]